MPNGAFSDRITNLALDLAWRLWTELGVSGWDKRAANEAIDLEPLLLFTAWIGRFDHRLMDESLDWSITNSRFASSARLRSLSKRADPEVVQAFGGYAATVRGQVPKVNWPGEGEPRDMVPSRKSEPPRLAGPTLVQLRLRALFGVSARSEILRSLLMEPPRSWSVAELASEVGYGKVNVASSLEALAAAGAVQVDTVRNQFRYRLARRTELAAFVGALPPFQPDWPARLSLAAELVRIARNPQLGSGIARVANLAARLREWQTDLHRLGLIKLAPVPGQPDFNERFERWAIGLLSYWCGVETVSPDGVRYDVRRTEIAWETTVRANGQPPRPLTLPYWEERYKQAPRSDHMISDDSVGVYVLAHELMRRAALGVGSDIGPFTYQPEVLAFAEEFLRPISRGQSRGIDEDFIRLWGAERQARIGGRPSI